VLGSQESAITSQSMSKIIIRIGSAMENMRPERREAIEDLATQLRQHGHLVVIEERQQIPGRYGLPWAEQVGIFVGSGVATTLLNATVSDVYNTAKSWARNRFHSKRKAQPVGHVQPERVTIYGSDNKVLCSWKVDENGELEDDSGS